MSVYVDNAFIPFRNMLMSHMTADTEDELDKMAELLGLKKRYKQKREHAWTWRSHYDICKSKRALAIKLGAIPLTTREICKRCAKTEKKEG